MIRIAALEEIPSAALRRDGIEESVTAVSVDIII